MSELAPPARSQRLHDELREPRLRERLAVRLACEIVSGRMAVGGAFPSADDIVQRFGVSRTVARETVHTLSMLGLVRVQHGKRSEVLREDDWDILSDVVQEAMRRENRVGPLLRDLYEFRLLVEPDAARLMAERGTDREVAELERLARTMSELAAEPGGQHGPAGDAAFHAADWDFHHLVARASGNALLGAVIRDIREVLVTLWTVSRLGPDEIDRVAEYHTRIASAIARREPEGAAVAMRDHLTWASTLDLTQMRDSAET
jgi:GntR family transcriptional repressor for pyruvate dehydrogenase complex